VDAEPKEEAAATPPVPLQEAGLVSGGGSCGGRVFAFDKSRERAGVLRARVDDAGCGRLVTVSCADVVAANLGADPALGRVRVAVVDPSCSGSGMAAHGAAGGEGGAASTADDAI
jgi:16S rRNA C967 or C1407 C5-methylase (RsmB/RsmF family)